IVFGACRSGLIDPKSLLFATIRWAAGRRSRRKRRALGDGSTADVKGRGLVGIAGHFGARLLRAGWPLSIVAPLLLVGYTPSASGQQYWDGATTTGDGTIHGGTGIWNNSTTNWTNGT